MRCLMRRPGGSSGARSAGLEGLAWRERVRGGLWVILSFLEREPVLARICVVHALHGGAETLEASRAGPRAVWRRSLMRAAGRARAGRSALW